MPSSISILIDKDGNYVNPEQSLIVSSPLTGESGGLSLGHQITLEFFNEIKQSGNLKIVDETSVVNTGLSGEITFAIYPSLYAPYAITIQPTSTLDISQECMLQWTGRTQRFDISAANIVGCNYIRIILDNI